MCKPDSKIHFCTCEEEAPQEILHNQNSRRFKRNFDKNKYLETQLTWILQKYIRTEETDIIGKCVMPVDKLTKELTTEYVLTELNNQTLFDFDYTPSEGDNLLIDHKYTYRKLKKRERPPLYGYMSFIFRNGSWKDAIYLDLFIEFKDIRSGKVKIS